MPYCGGSEYDGEDGDSMVSERRGVCNRGEQSEACDAWAWGWAGHGRAGQGRAGHSLVGLRCLAVLAMTRCGLGLRKCN